MKQRLLYLLIFAVVAVIVTGCDSGTEITSISASTYVAGSMRASQPSADTIAVSRTDGIWLAANSALYVKIHFPDDVPAGSVKNAHIVIPVVPQNHALFGGTSGARPNVTGPHLKLAAYRILDPYWDTKLPTWLGKTPAPPPDASVAVTPSGTDALFGPGSVYEYSHVRLNITDMMQAWHTGEPNYGMLIVADGTASGATAAWKHADKTQLPIHERNTRPGADEEQKTQPQSEKVRVVVTWGNAH